MLHWLHLKRKLQHVGHKWVICGSHPDCFVGQWVKWVNKCDPLSTLVPWTIYAYFCCYVWSPVLYMAATDSPPDHLLLCKWSLSATDGPPMQQSFRRSLASIVKGLYHSFYSTEAILQRKKQGVYSS